MKRETAVAILREIMANRKIHFKWSSLVHGKFGGYELHVKSESDNPAHIKPIVLKHDLEIKEDNGLLVIYKKH